MSEDSLKDKYRKFDGRYYAEAYNTGFYSYNKFHLTNLHEAFTEDGVTGARCVEIGCGPMPYLLTTASKYCPYLVISDFSQSNINEVKKWLTNDVDAANWTTHFKYVAQLEGFEDLGAGTTAVMSRLRNTLKLPNVLMCDVTQPYPLQEKRDPFDVLITCATLECAAPKPEDYLQALKNVGNLLVPGGTLLSMGYLECSWYVVAGIKYPELWLNEDYVRKSLQQANFKLSKYKEIPMLDLPDHGGTDCTKAFFSMSKKM